MPTYEYRCRDCGEDLEVQQSFTEDSLTVCPSCGGSLRKLFGNVGISFKGTGFYKNDSRSSGSSTSKSGSSGSGGSSDGGSSDGGGSSGDSTSGGSGGSSSDSSSSSSGSSGSSTSSTPSA